MELQKLLTLGQFVDDIYANRLYCDDALIDVCNYNGFLKQTLTEEIIVNQFDINSKWADIYPIVDVFAIGRYRIKIETQGYKHPVIKVNRIGKRFTTVKTLHDLAEATNGELTLKNVTI